MKKVVLCVMFLLAMGFVFSQETESVAPRVRSLIQDDLFDNEELIKKESVNLTDAERLSIYNSFEEEPWASLALNFFLGYGIGSFVQGDTLGGVIGVSADLVGLGVTIAGLIPMYELISDPDNTTYTSATDAYSEFIIYYAVGGAIILGSRIFQLVRPIAFTNSFNDDLKNALGMSGVSYQLLPTYDFTDNQASLVASVSFKL